MGGGGLLPFLAMVVVQVGLAGMNIIMKLALDSGMNPIVMVVYRQMFATFCIAPLAFFCERKTRPKFTREILFHILAIGTLGATLNQCFYFVGLKHSTPTITCALNNLLPAFTFILAVPFKMETVGIRKFVGQAKVAGTILCVGGAMFMSFYKGKIIDIVDSGVHWRYAENMRAISSGKQEVTFMGPLFVAIGCLGWAGWFIVQGKLSKIFNAPYTSTGLMCFVGTIETMIVGVIVEHRVVEWSLTSTIRLIATLYGGVVGSALSFCLMAWCVQRKGPLYVSAFSPLMLIIVAIFGWALLDEKLNVGTVVGSVLIVVGLYMILWAKGNDTNKVVRDETESNTIMPKEPETEMRRDDVEMSTYPNGKSNTSEN